MSPRDRAPQRRLLSIALAAVVTSAPACVTHIGRNYDDPDGPLFEGSYGRAGEARAELLVVSFNVHFAKRLERVMGLLREPPLRDADVLLLQELDETAADWLARELHFDFAYAASAVHPKTGRDFGNAIFTPWKLESARKLLLPHRARVRGLRRSAVTATVVMGEQRVQVYGVHLETLLELGREGRRDQARRIFEDARSSPHPVIVAGDWNGWQGDEIARAEGFEWPTRSLGATVAVFSWDHIFARGFAAAGESAAGAVPHRGASDHRPVWALLRTGFDACSGHAAPRS